MLLKFNFKGKQDNSRIQAFRAGFIMLSRFVGYVPWFKLTDVSSPTVADIFNGITLWGIYWNQCIKQKQDG